RPGLVGELCRIEADQRHQVEGRPVPYDLRARIHRVGQLLGPAERQVLRRDELAVPVAGWEHELIALLWASRFRILASSEGTVEERETQPQAEGCLQYRATPLGHGPESSRSAVGGAITACVLARKHHGESPLVARVTGTYVTPRSGCRPSARMNRKARVF